jgi:hypothetical protein
MGKWIDSFFAEGNLWELDKIKIGDGYPAELQLHLEALVRPALQDKFPVILPRLTKKKEIIFYALADNSRQLEEIRNVVKAYLGKVHVQIDPRIYKQSVDSIENAALERFPHGFFKLNIPFALNGNKPVVYEVMKTLCSLIEKYHNRPLIYATVQRPTGRILRDFFIACSHKKGDEAKEYYQELKAHNKLTSRNLFSIELQALAAANKWQSILDHPMLPDIIYGGVPSYIVEILLEAINRTVLFSDSPNDYALAKVRMDLQFLHSLFVRPIEISNTKQQINNWKIWAIGATALGYARVFELVPTDIIDREWLRKLEQWAGFSSTPVVEAKEITSDLDKLLNSEPSVEIAFELLKESFMASINDGIAIYQRLSAYPEHIIGEIVNHSSANHLLKTLYHQYAEKKVVENWKAWLNLLLADSDPKALLQIAIENNNDWTSEEWEEDEVISLLNQLSNHKNAIVFRDVIPILQEWICKNSLVPSSRFIEQILFILATDDVFSVQDLLLMSDLIYSLINVAHTEQQYLDAIEGLDLCWDRVKSAKSLNYVLETIDILLDNVCANTQARINIWNAIQQFCISNWQRLSEQQQLIAIQFGKEITTTSNQFPSLKTKESNEIANINMTGKRLAIYTLTEGAGRRAKTILAQLFPELDIRVNHDKSATDTLINLASTADYFIFASKSAAHQAFYPVTKKRSDILYPDGKGSSSIVGAFINALTVF